MDLEVVESKKCTKCGKIKSLINFYKRSDRPGHYVAHCIACKKSKYQESAKDPAYMEEKNNRSKKWKSENPLHARFLMARANALNSKRRKSRYFLLTLEQCKDLWSRGCHYCCKDILSETGVGLDRIDNSGHYELSNVLPCCGDCNKVRNTVLTVEETEIAINAVLEFRKKVPQVKSNREVNTNTDRGEGGFGSSGR